MLVFQSGSTIMGPDSIAQTLKSGWNMGNEPSK